MMADTYGRVKENSTTEALAARYRRIFKHRRLMLTVPPPFNAPYVIPTLLAHVFQAGPGDVAAFCRRMFGVAKRDTQRDSKATSSGDDVTKKRKRLKTLLDDAKAKQYVNKFLEDEARREAASVAQLAASAGQRVASLEETFNHRIATLTEETCNRQFEGLRQKGRTQSHHSRASPASQPT